MTTMRAIYSEDAVDIRPCQNRQWKTIINEHILYKQDPMLPDNMMNGGNTFECPFLGTKEDENVAKSFLNKVIGCGALLP